jgi:hypothetical protein
VRNKEKTIRHHLVVAVVIVCVKLYFILPPKKENYLAPKTCKLFIKSQQRTDVSNISSNSIERNPFAAAAVD